MKDKFLKLPDYLIEDIKLVEDARKTKELYDCEECQLLATINQALMAKDIDERTAKEIRVEYFGDYYA